MADDREAVELEEDAKHRRSLALQARRVEEDAERHAAAAAAEAAREEAVALSDLQKAEALLAEAAREKEQVQHDEEKFLADLQEERVLERRAAPSNRQGYGSRDLNSFEYQLDKENEVREKKAELMAEKRALNAEKTAFKAVESEAAEAAARAQQELEMAQRAKAEATREEKIAHDAEAAFARDAQEVMSAQHKAAAAIFKAMDCDGNGTLSYSEMHSKLHDFGLGDREIENLFTTLDTNHDGVVSAAEFDAGYAKYHSLWGGGLH